MGLDQIAEDVRRFILTSVPSVPFLEAALLMQSEPTAGWDGKQLAKRLYLNERAARRLLCELHDAGILILVEGDRTCFYFSPASEELRDLLRRVGITYSRHLIAVTNLIHSASQEKAHTGDHTATPHLRK